MRVKNIVVTKGTGKMKGIYSINSNPLNNKHCYNAVHKAYNKFLKTGTHESVCGTCYSFYQLCTYRQSCQLAYTGNDNILTRRVLSPSELPFLNYSIFRYNSHGELHNTKHLINYCNIARYNKHTTFTLWTKKVKLVQANIKYRPKNLQLIYSSPILNRQPEVPEHFNRTFTVYTEPNNKINCNKSCLDCRTCYNPSNRTRHVREYIKITPTTGLPKVLARGVDKYIKT